MPETYDIFRPAQQTGPVIFAAPHSGRVYPQDFKDASHLDESALRSSEDLFVDLLYSSAPRFGAPLIVARYPRAYVDLNRGADELDPALIHDTPNQRLNARTASGLGVIPRVVADSQAIQWGKMPLDQAEARLDHVWRPYHSALRELIRETRAQFGTAILVDCHSMPHSALNGQREPLPEVVLGDRYGSSAAPWVMEHIERAFDTVGLRCARNAPFAGAYIAKTYGQPREDVHCIQVELDRSLYVDEVLHEPGPRVAAFERRLRPVIAQITDLAVGAIAAQ